MMNQNRIKQKSLWGGLLGLFKSEQTQPGPTESVAAPSAPSPGDCETHIKLGNSLKEQGKIDEAISIYDRALEVEPESAHAHYYKGNALMELKRLDEAETSFKRAIELKPDYPQAHNNLGNVLKDRGRLDEAVARYRRALEINPNYVLAHNNLGNAMRDCGRLDEALVCYRRALEIDPNFVEAHTNLGNALCDLGQLNDGLACYQRAIEINPGFFEAHSNLLLVYNYQVGLSSEIPFAQAKSFGELAASKARPYTDWSNAPKPERCLRVGWVSGDFGEHSVGHFVEGVLAALATEAAGQLEHFAYPSFTCSGPVTDRIMASCHGWHSAVGLSDERLAEQIRKDGIDILIDLSGHTAHNRLPMFAWKPAPVQATWLGYLGTTGIDAIDYLIADSWVFPQAEESCFAERISRLPESYICLTAPSVDVQVSGLPAVSNGYVTFGSFNNLSKVNDEVIEVWARILLSVQDSLLFLKAKQLGDGLVRLGVVDRFAKHGIEAHRLILEGHLPERGRHLSAYHRVDIALDTFPYPGVTTSAESLWMGVPALTLAGDRFISRQGVGLMMNAGLPDWVAADVDDYVARAVAHAADIQKLATLRSNLRQQVLASPVFDTRRFARHFETTLREMWAKWCKQQRGGSL